MTAGKKRRKRVATTGARADERQSVAGQRRRPAAVPVVLAPLALSIAVVTLWKAAFDGVLAAAEAMTSAKPARSERPAVLTMRLDESAGLTRSNVVDFAAYRARRMI